MNTLFTCTVARIGAFWGRKEGFSVFWWNKPCIKSFPAHFWIKIKIFSLNLLQYAKLYIKKNIIKINISSQIKS